MSSNLTWGTKGKQTGRWVSAGLLALLLVLPQLPFWAARANLSLDRPLFNLDLILATLVTCLFRYVGLVMLVLAWAVDISRIASLNYHFVSPIEFAATAEFADMVVLRQVLSWKLLLGMVALTACLTGVARLARRSMVLHLLAAAVVLELLDMSNGSSRLFGWGGDRFRVEANIAGSPGWNVWRAEQLARSLTRMPMSRFSHPRTFETIADWHRAHPDESVLLILVESMGKPTSQELSDWLSHRLTTPELASRWTLRRDADAFYGPTTSGELRVLCGLRGSYVGLKPEEEAECLPRRWTAAGLQAYGLHGFHLRMFDRQNWWPRLGLTPWKFDPQADSAHRFGCNGAFPGICDDAVLEQAVALADKPSRLVYALTLDTHLPLRSDRRLPSDLAALCERTHTNDVACQMVAQLGAVLDTAAARLASMDKPPLVVIVGDHSPPFALSDPRKAFDSAVVPLFVLIPQ